LLTKKDIKENFLKEKSIFKVLKYPIIWSILVWTSRFQVSLCFWLFWKYYSNSTINKEPRPFEEWRVLWFWATYALSIFIIAWCFIWLSFWNKMLRNIWILFYVLWIFFIIFWLFLDYWYVSDWLGNLVI
jgi:cell division protein FtsW (lipid II flippase)